MSEMNVPLVDALRQRAELLKAAADKAMNEMLNPVLAILLSNSASMMREAADLLAGAAPRLEAGWQPIATAPKDGTWILVGMIDRHGQFFRAAAAKWHLIAWYAVRSGEACSWATHWVPLPKKSTSAAIQAADQGEQT